MKMYVANPSAPLMNLNYVSIMIELGPRSDTYMVKNIA